MSDASSWQYFHEDSVRRGHGTCPISALTRRWATFIMELTIQRVVQLSCLSVRDVSMPRRRIAAYNGLFILLALVICLHPALARDNPPGCQAVEPIPPSRQHLPESPVDIQVEVPGTPDANLLPYMGRLIASIAGNLRLRLPGPVASGEEGTVVIRVQVRKDGSLSRDGLSVACTSGIKNIDATAKSAIQSGAPFEPLPQTYGGSDLVLVVRISYRSYRYIPSNPSRRT
jgi:TonB family protein